MEFLKYYLGIDELQKRRQAQLLHQARTDQFLKNKARFECPQALSAYLLREREDNRQMTADYEHQPFSEYCSIAKKQLDFIQSRQDEMDEAMRSPSWFCRYLEQKIRSPGWVPLNVDQKTAK
jgi:hypothetical protein